jgi:DNA adenine methylase
VKPPVPYFGGKQILGARIAALLPAHGHYVEPYCGSLSVMLAKPVSAMETVNDLDRALQTFWRVLRDRPADLERACALTPHSLAEFRDVEAVDAPPQGGELEVARRVWVRLTQGRAGTLCTTGWRHFVKPTGSFGMPDYLTAYAERIASAAERLHHVSLECRPALELVEWYGRAEGVLLYVDPPYVRSTRSSDAYRHKMTDADHRDLAGALRKARASVVLSGYPSPLYDELYAGWNRTEFTAGTGQNAETWGNRTEVLWSNRPFPAAPLELFSAEAAS